MNNARVLLKKTKICNIFNLCLQIYRKLANTEMKTLSLESRIADLESPIADLETPIANLETPIGDLELKFSIVLLA